MSGACDLPELKGFGDTNKDRLNYVLRNAVSAHCTLEGMEGLYQKYESQIDKIVEATLVYDVYFMRLFPDIYTIKTKAQRAVLGDSVHTFTQVDKQINEHIITFHHAVCDIALEELRDFLEKKPRRLNRYLLDVFMQADTNDEIYWFVKYSNPFVYMYYMAGYWIGANNGYTPEVREKIAEELNRYFYIPRIKGDEKLYELNLERMCSTPVCLDDTEHELYSKFTDPVIGNYELETNDDLDFTADLSSCAKSYPSLHLCMVPIEYKLTVRKGHALPAQRALVYFLTGRLQSEYNAVKNNATTVNETCAAVDFNPQINVQNTPTA